MFYLYHPQPKAPTRSATTCQVKQLCDSDSYPDISRIGTSGHSIPIVISIHALHTECDLKPVCNSVNRVDIQNRENRQDYGMYEPELVDLCRQASLAHVVNYAAQQQDEQTQVLVVYT